MQGEQGTVYKKKRSLRWKKQKEVTKAVLWESGEFFIAWWKTGGIANEKEKGDPTFYCNGLSVRLGLDIWAIAWMTDVELFWSCVTLL